MIYGDDLMQGIDTYMVRFIKYSVFSQITAARPLREGE